MAQKICHSPQSRRPDRSEELPADAPDSDLPFDVDVSNHDVRNCPCGECAASRRLC